MNVDDVNYFGSKPNFSASFDRLTNASEKQAADDLPSLQAQELPDKIHILENKESDDFDIPARFKDGMPTSYTRIDVPRGAWAEIDLDAIAHNVRVARRRLGNARYLMAVVKADGYGHGAVRTAKVALKNGADHLAVSTVEEGVELRQEGIDAPILILSQPPMRTISLLLAYDIMPTVTTSEFALALGEAADQHGVVAKYHLAVDTGMNRIGVSYLDAVEFLQSINFHRGLKLDGVFTHFATADEASDWDFKIQLQRFNETLQLMRNARIDTGIVHAANSATVERYPDAYFDMGRVGITMYGLAPSAYLRNGDKLIPAMSIKTQVTFVKEPAMGEGVSYGLDYRVAKPVQIATVPIGYADGLRRNLSGRMRVLVHGRPCLQVGKICMDQMMIEIPIRDFWREEGGGVEIGDEVVLIGHQGELEITADMMADELDTINYEIVCAFGMRLPRIYVHGRR